MADRNDPIEAALKRANQLDLRPLHLFFLPASHTGLVLPGGEPVRSVAMVELSPHEMRMVIKAASGDTTTVASQKLAHSIVLVNCNEMGGEGKQLTAADGSADKWVERLHPKVFDLLLNAYNNLHMNEVEDVEAFLATRKVVARS